MAAVDFLHHENPSTWAGLIPQPSVQKWVKQSALDFFLPILADRSKPLRELAGQSPKSRKDQTIVGKFTAPLGKTRIGQPIREHADFGLWP
ncbi:hypothetical protein TNCV_5010531 [Trichonephila clavipes]|nr:hypothetical protein TNCV_5010531 [Trichonephila clavipes]